MDVRICNPPPRAFDLVSAAVLAAHDALSKADRALSRFCGGRLLVDRSLTFWTLTVWRSEQEMKKFRGAGAHAKAMRKLPLWCDEASYAHWNSEGETVATWPEAYARLVAEGKLSAVMHPSPNHEARRFREPRLEPTIGQDLKPKVSG